MRFALSLDNLKAFTSSNEVRSSFNCLWLLLICLNCTVSGNGSRHLIVSCKSLLESNIKKFSNWKACMKINIAMSHTSSLLLQSLTSMLINSIWTLFDSIMTTCVRSPKRILIKKVPTPKRLHFWGTVRLLYTLSFQGLEKTLNSSLSFEQATLIFCLPGATSCLSHVMILLEDELPRPLPTGQVHSGQTSEICKS